MSWRVLILLAAVLLTACQGGQPSSSTATAPASSVVSSPVPSALPTEEPVDQVPPDAGLPRMSCLDQSGGTQSGQPVLQSEVSTDSQSQYDRVVFGFAGAGWSYEVHSQPSASFTEDASGRSVSLAGSAGLRVVMRNATKHRGGGTVQEDVTITLPTLLEVRLLGDFEGVVTYGLGLRSANCFRAFPLTNPSRLVIDVAH